MPDDALIALARLVIFQAEAAGVKIAAAESCTGGLIAALLTEIPGSSAVFERGFVTYSNKAKEELLGVPGDLIADHGAVSEPVARAMAEGALAHAPVQLTVSVTGVAGPGGGGALKPVGLVHFACAGLNKPTSHQERRFGDIGRTCVRRAACEVALNMLRQRLSSAPPLL